MNEKKKNLTQVFRNNFLLINDKQKFNSLMMKKKNQLIYRWVGSVVV